MHAEIYLQRPDAEAVVHTHGHAQMGIESAICRLPLQMPRSVLFFFDCPLWVSFPDLDARNDEVRFASMN